jgi:hypothetical protein
MRIRTCPAVLLLLLITVKCFAQEVDKEEFRVVGFWNLENLYDTIDDPLKNDDDFLASGQYRWTGERYWKKIDRLAEVIALMGTEVSRDGLSLLGVCEVENVAVLNDVIASPRLKNRNYKAVLIEGPDIRGVDPGFIYNPAHFSVKKAVAYPLRLVTDSNHKTRDILVVSGVFMGEPVCVLVNHWPSRRGGELASRPNRSAAGRLARHIADSAQQRDPKCRIMIMGDLNDDPVSESIHVQLATFNDAENRGNGKYFNPMETPFKKGIGTLAWQDSWNLFDQIILSHNWLGAAALWHYHEVRIFNKAFLRSDQGNFKGYPFRTYSGGKYTGGYSDHFPSYLVFKKH